MPVSQAFLELIRECLEPVGPIAIRRMFGGAGIYSDGVMFALIEDDVLYFKADDVTKARFIGEGLTPFAFEGQTRMVETSYWRAPERLFDEPEEMLDFARQAIQAARLVKQIKSSNRPKAGLRGATSKAGGAAKPRLRK